LISIRRRPSRWLGLGNREVGDFAGTCSSVGGRVALVGGVNRVHLCNGVTTVLQGPKAGLELRKG